LVSWPPPEAYPVLKVTWKSAGAPAVGTNAKPLPPERLANPLRSKVHEVSGFGVPATHAEVSYAGAWSKDMAASPCVHDAVTLHTCTAAGPRAVRAPSGFSCSVSVVSEPLRRTNEALSSWPARLPT